MASRDGEALVNSHPEPNGDATIKEDLSPSKRIGRYDQYHDPRGLRTVLRKTRKQTTKANKKKYALLVRRIFDEKARYRGKQVDVKSHGIRDVLREINLNVEGLNLTNNEPMVEPKLFLMSLDGIQKRLQEECLKETPDHVLISDLRTAVHFTLEEYNETINDIQALKAQNEITYTLLWALFKPNTLIYKFDEQLQQPELLKCISYAELLYDKDDNPYAEVACRVVRNDGNNFGLARTSLVIKYFSGAKKIQDLNFYPLEFLQGKEELKEKIAARGRKFARMSIDGHTSHEISGNAITDVEKKDGEKGTIVINSCGRVMIDSKAFTTFNPSSKYNMRVDQPLDPHNLTEEQELICTPVMLGYCFGIKKWGGFAMDRLTDIAWADKALDSLVISPKHKDLIKALIGQHMKRAASYDDFVSGKGKGLIGLLSGHPGCGKTFTAEAIAENTRRVLYAVSAGELGGTPEQVDSRLTEILKLAESWEAVFLLDEVDVFLRKRGYDDVNRNAVVSIFLRQLEYFPGVLILTTNMVEQIDPAFDSRIHFSINYPDLDFAARRAVWSKFLDKAIKGGKPIDDSDIDRVAQRELNGRQIKNAVGNAQSLALEDDVPLSIAHIDKILDIMTEWSSVQSSLVPKA